MSGFLVDNWEASRSYEIKLYMSQLFMVCRFGCSGVVMDPLAVESLPGSLLMACMSFGISICDFFIPKWVP